MGLSEMIEPHLESARRGNKDGGSTFRIPVNSPWFYVRSIHNSYILSNDQRKVSTTPQRSLSKPVKYIQTVKPIAQRKQAKGNRTGHDIERGVFFLPFPEGELGLKSDFLLAILTPKCFTGPRPFRWLDMDITASGKYVISVALFLPRSKTPRKRTRLGQPRPVVNLRPLNSKVRRK
jgi:hypothetical protein